MNGTRLNFGSLLLVAALAGCAGKDFVRPGPDAFRLGETTYSQVVQQLGEPRKSGDVVKNDKIVQSITYVYASSGGEASEAGVTPARGLTYYFYDDRLVGQEFLSSFKADSSNFDETKVERIRKGETTRAQVIELMGAPTASFVPPMARSSSGETIGYGYAAARAGLFSGFKAIVKSLRVSFDDRGLASEVDYSSAGNK